MTLPTLILATDPPHRLPPTNTLRELEYLRAVAVYNDAVIVRAASEISRLRAELRCQGRLDVIK